jgi:hypothetical protein
MGPMGRPSKHCPEVRERAVRMVFDHGLGASIAMGGNSVGRREARDPHGIVARWVRQTERDCRPASRPGQQ